MSYTTTTNETSQIRQLPSTVSARGGGARRRNPGRCHPLKSTLLRACNRLVELVDGATVEGAVWLGEQEVYGPGVDPASVRQAIGMVFEHSDVGLHGCFTTVFVDDGQRSGV